MKRTVLQDGCSNDSASELKHLNGLDCGEVALLSSIGSPSRPLVLPYPTLDYVRVLANGGVHCWAAGLSSLSLRLFPLSLESGLLLALQRR